MMAGRVLADRTADSIDNGNAAQVVADATAAAAAVAGSRDHERSL